MGDERERMSQDIEGLRKRLLVVNERWEVVCADLKAENALLKQSNARFFDDVVALRDVLRALVDATAPWSETKYGSLGEQAFAWDSARAVAVRLLLPEGP